MAKPRIFISSTYYDLRAVRADLDRFIRELGYEPVLFERGSIPYGTEQRLEDDCYREISSCDILLAIVGGKFGTTSADQRYSITQKELQSAIEAGKQIYIFVEHPVHAEYITWLANKDVEGFNPASVDDKRVFLFLEEVYSLTGGNPVYPFEISEDITSYLKEQWSGLFQRLLQESSRQKEVRLVEDMRSITGTLRQLVTFLSSEKEKGDQAIRDILLSNHPAFEQIKQSLEVPYRVFFTTRFELNDWIKNRRFEATWDPWDDKIDHYIWVADLQEHKTTFTVDASVFDDEGRLIPCTPEEWDDSLITVTREESPTKDGLPF